MTKSKPIIDQHFMSMHSETERSVWGISTTERMDQIRKQCIGRPEQFDLTE